VEQGVPEFDQSFLQEIIHPPFRIVYRRDSRRVRVIHVWCGEHLLHLAAAGDKVS
jgi:toxin ParE1/3/4